MPITQKRYHMYLPFTDVFLDRGFLAEPAAASVKKKRLLQTQLNIKGAYNQLLPATRYSPRSS